MCWTHISHSVADSHVRLNNLIHREVDPHVNEMEAKNSYESCGWHTVDRE